MTPALHNLLAFLHFVETQEAGRVFRDNGLPLLRGIFPDADHAWLKAKIASQRNGQEPMLLCSM
jgi:hypothetical protein